MGGRSSGGSGNAANSKDPFVVGSRTSPLGAAEPTEIENEKSKSSSSMWKRENLEAEYVKGSPGTIMLSHPTNVEYKELNKNTTASYGKINHGFVNTANGSMSGKWVGINWNNTKEVVGNTYNVKGMLKEKGFRWNGSTKSWVK